MWKKYEVVHKSIFIRKFSSYCECEFVLYCQCVGELGSVLVQKAFPLHASEISDKSETGREKHVSVPAESSYFFPFKFFCTGEAKMWRFSGSMWQKMSQVKKSIFVCESVTFFSEMWQIWRVTFFVTEKSDKCDVTHPNLRREAQKKSGSDRP